MNDLELFQPRIAHGPGSTISELLVQPDDGQIFDWPRLCWMLEEGWHEEKVPGETCIPPGRYEIIIIHDSPMALDLYQRFDWFRGLPSIEGVPNFRAVRIHPGNDVVGTDDDSDGCPLPGHERHELPGGDWQVWYSVPAFKDLCELLYTAILDDGRRSFLTVSDDKLRL